MAKENEATATLFFRELFQLGIYKRTQGRIVRQATFVAIMAAVLLGAWRLSVTFGERPLYRLWVPTAIAVVGTWLAYRAVNMPRFADFLISVEAEMNKVSWPSRQELFRSSVVVMVLIFGMAAILYGYDLIWKGLLQLIGITGGPGGG